LAPDSLVLADVSVCYGTVEVVHGVNLSVGRGELVYLMGRNGVGKTTTLKAVMGLVPVRSGRILYEGAEVAGRQPFEMARLGIGYVPDNRRIFPFLSVRENLETFAENPGGDAGWTLAKIHELFPILKKRDGVRAGTLSGGEQEMLAVARALMRNPRMLLLDEPFEGLAPLVVGSLAEVFSRIKGEISILLVEQNEKHSVRIADRCYRMERGRIESEYVPPPAGPDEDGHRVIGTPGGRTFWES
jgi:branched-chain amino acid transport system ATP-binding protein